MVYFNVSKLPNLPFMVRNNRVQITLEDMLLLTPWVTTEGCNGLSGFQSPFFFFFF